MVGDLLLQVAGKNVLSKPVDKVKRLILGAPGTSCEFVFKRWTHGGDESVIYSLTMKRQPAAYAGEDAPADGAWVLFQQAVGSLFCVCPFPSTLSLRIVSMSFLASLASDSYGPCVGSRAREQSTTGRNTLAARLQGSWAFGRAGSCASSSG